MARPSAEGQLTILALIAEQYAQIVDLREALARAQAENATLRELLDDQPKESPGG